MREKILKDLIDAMKSQNKGMTVSEYERNLFNQYQKEKKNY